MSNMPEPRDDALLNQVERLLLDGTRSGQPVLDDLSGLVPTARPAFQQQLEDKLVAHLDKTSSGRHFMPVYSQKRKRHPFRLPLGTMAAALVGILIGAGMMFAFAVPEPVESNPAASSIGCVTPTWTAFYVVRENDNISEIASKFGVSGSELIQQNCLRPAIIRPGMRLHVPYELVETRCDATVWSDFYRTQQGEPLAVIADRFNVSADVFAIQNCLEGDFVEAGVIVYVPGGSADVILTAVAVATPIFPKMPTLPAVPAPVGEPVMPPIPADIPPVPYEDAYLPIVIAAHDIPAGAIILPDMITRIFLTRETLSQLGSAGGSVISADTPLPGTPLGFYGNVEDILWQTTTIEIPRWQPVKASMLAALANADSGEQKRIGILMAFNELPGGICQNTPEPTEINTAVGQQLAEILRARGYHVSQMYPDSPRLAGWNGDMLIALYTDDCATDRNQDVDGFLPVRVYLPGQTPAEVGFDADNPAQVLMACVQNQYAAGTGLPQRSFRTLDGGYTYNFFRQIDPATPAMALHMGSLAKNKDFLLNHPVEIAAALAQGIECYFSPDGNLSNLLPAGTVAISIPVSNLNTVPYEVKQGDTVNVLASLLFVEAQELNIPVDDMDEDTPESQIVFRTIVQNAQVVNLGQPDSAENAPELITLAVAPQDAVVLQWALDAKLPLTFEPAQLGDVWYNLAQQANDATTQQTQEPSN